MTFDELKKTHWATLKKMVEDAGGTYEDKEKAIQFLVDSGVVTGADENPANELPADELPVEEIPMLKIDEPTAKTKSKVVVMLDKSKPYGDIFGDVEDFPTARYTQGEHLFNSLGEKL